MKKLSLVAIKNALVGFGYNDAEILQEIETEINKDNARKEANASKYDSIKRIVMDALPTVETATIAEIWDSIEKQVPAGITKGNVQYALTKLWQDEIVKVEGKPNGYKRA